MRCASPPEASWKAAELQITESDILQRFDLCVNAFMIGEKFKRLADAHIQHIRDIFPLVFDLQRLRIIARPLHTSHGT
jgi:hypothetical protein